MFTSILCPVDFSDHSKRALRAAVAIAASSGAHLTLLHVTDPLLDASARAAGSAGTIAAQTQRELRTLLADATPSGFTSPMAVAVSVGKPAEEILKQAAECGADLIVMGTQGRGAAERLITGSTTSRVLQATTVPVLAVPPARR